MISGETLRQLRTLKGVKQKTVAKALGISQPAYCKLEHSEQVNDEKLVQVLSVLGYTIEIASKIVENLPPLY